MAGGLAVDTAVEAEEEEEAEEADEATGGDDGACCAACAGAFFTGMTALPASLEASDAYPLLAGCTGASTGAGPSKLVPSFCCMPVRVA